MRDSYRIYENSPKTMKAAMEIGWTQNVVIMEANLTMELREWYLKAAKQFGWPKAELMEKIAANAQEEIALNIEEISMEKRNKMTACNGNGVSDIAIYIFL